MVQLIHTEPLHSCEYCGLEYRKTPAYIKHLIELHNTDLPKCSFCYKQFLSNKDLHEHLENMHTADGGNKRQKCSTCSCSFKRLSDLKSHLARKHGPIAKPVLQCNYCGCEFYQRSTYTNHMLEKHWNKTVFQCNECLYKFKYKRLLERHIQIKHGTINQWAKCTFCPASYKWAHDLKKHYQQKHLTLWLKKMKVKTTADEGQNFKCSFDACLQSFESKEKCMEHYLNELKVNLANDIHCGEILKTKQIPNQNVGNKSYSLIMVPAKFPQEIVDFECELQKVNEFRKLIDERISDSRTDQEINHDCDDTASSITDAESELTNGLQDVLQVKCSIVASVITDSVDKHNVNDNLVAEEEKQYFRRNDFVTLNENDTYIKKDKGSIVLKDIKIIVTRLVDKKILNDDNQKVQSTNDTSKLNIHDLNASHLIRNNLLIDINVEKKIATFYSCRLCKLKFRVKKSLEHHMSEDHNVGCVLASHKCKFCDAVFPFKHYLRQHIRGEHRHVLQRFRPSKLIKTCAKCELTFESAQLYNIHMKIEHFQSNQTVLRSSSCNITVNTRGILNKHRRLKHNQKQHLNSSVNEEQRLDNAAASYKCIACGVVCKDKLCLEEHMQLVHRSQENRQNVENDLVEINKKVEEMKLKRKKISRAVRNIKMSNGIKKNVTRKKFTMKIRPFGRNLKDLNSRFVLKNGVITSSKFEEDSLASKKQNFVSETNSSLCSQQRNLGNINMQESVLNGLDLINTPKQSTSLGTKKTLIFRSRKKILQNFKNNVSGVKRKLIEDKKRKSVERAMHLPGTGEVKTDYDCKNNRTTIAETKRASSRRNSIVKECKNSQQFSENVTFSSNNSEFADLTSIHSSIDLNSHHNSYDIKRNSQKNKKNVKVDSITAKMTPPETLSNKNEVFEDDVMVCIMTDQTVLKSYSVIESECNMNTSVKLTDKGKDYKCYLCNDIFNNRNSLVAHIFFHNIVYRCPMCRSVYKRKGDLTKHVKSKHDVPIYTTTPPDILKNIYTDHSYCIKLFNKKVPAENILPNSDLMKQQYKCNFCDKYFAFTDKLQQHIKQYHKMINVTLCICVTCNAVFNCNVNLRDHVKIVHSIDNVCMKDVSETSRNKVKMQSKKFNWKKALVQTYKIENISDNDKE